MVKDKVLSLLALFASTGTLLCCALPALLVTLGLGAAVAGAVSTLPWLVSMSQYKEWVFLAAGLLIGGNWLLMFRSRSAPACEVPDTVSSQTPCEVTDRFSRIVLWISTVLYAVGFFAAYAAFPLGKALGLLR